MLENSLLDFLHAMNCAESVTAAWKTTITYMRGLGARHVGNVLEFKESGLFHLNSTSPRVRQIYRELVYPDHDPKIEHCRRCVTPYFFGMEFWDSEPNLSKPRQWCDEEIAEAGGRASVAIPIHMPASQDRGHVCIATDHRRDEFVSFYEDRGAVLQLGAITAFNRIYALTRKEQATRIGLSERERECLLWLAMGLRNDRIAERMNIRPVTVALHTANARRKLNARTSAQAVVRAVQLGLIEP